MIDYPLCHYAKTILQINPDFIEPVEDDVPTDIELWMHDYGMEFDGEGDTNDPDLQVESYGLETDDYTDDV